jgi:hypothetical protein
MSMLGMFSRLAVVSDCATSTNLSADIYINQRSACALRSASQNPIFTPLGTSIEQFTRLTTRWKNASKWQSRMIHRRTRTLTDEGRCHKMRTTLPSSSHMLLWKRTIKSQGEWDGSSSPLAQKELFSRSRGNCNLHHNHFIFLSLFSGPPIIQ